MKSRVIHEQFGVHFHVHVHVAGTVYCKLGNFRKGFSFVKKNHPREIEKLLCRLLMEVNQTLVANLFF